MLFKAMPLGVFRKIVQSEIQITFVLGIGSTQSCTAMGRDCGRSSVTPANKFCIGFGERIRRRLFCLFQGDFKGKFMTTFSGLCTQNIASQDPLGCGVSAGCLGGQVSLPNLEFPLTVEPAKPRLREDARFINLWTVDVSFKLDGLIHLPRYVGRESYQTILDEKAGYQHLLLSEESRTNFGLQWGDWYFL